MSDAAWFALLSATLFEANSMRIYLSNTKEQSVKLLAPRAISRNPHVVAIHTRNDTAYNVPAPTSSRSESLFPLSPLASI